MDRTSFFMLNVFVNSFLTFFTVAVLIEGVISLFRIRQGRIAALLRMIPILKLPLDLFLYDFSRWSYLQGVNPLQCEDGTRTLSVMCRVGSHIQFTVPGDLTFTIADVVGYIVTPLSLKVFTALLISVSLGLLIRKLFLYRRSIAALHSLAKNSHLLNRETYNSSLSSYLKKRRLQIWTSQSVVGSPFIAGLVSLTIYIPSDLSNHLSLKEYEAVLAHEVEHARCRDSLVRLILDIIRTFFWWVPTKWLLNRIEEGQEVGCDLKCEKYGIDPIEVASAICKSAKYSHNRRDHIFSHYLTRDTILKRLDMLLKPPRFKRMRFALSCLAIGISFLMIFLGRFWMF